VDLQVAVPRITGTDLRDRRAPRRLEGMIMEVEELGSSDQVLYIVCIGRFSVKVSGSAFCISLLDYDRIMCGDAIGKFERYLTCALGHVLLRSKRECG
jgi:hypothetical protein